MAKIDDLNSIIPGAVKSGDGDFLSSINKTIDNFKSLLRMAESVRPKAAAVSEPVREPKAARAALSAPAPAPAPANPAQGVLKVFDLAIAAGLGDKTVNEIMTELGPHTLKEIREVVKNVAQLGK